MPPEGDGKGGPAPAARSRWHPEPVLIVGPGRIGCSLVADLAACAPGSKLVAVGQAERPECLCGFSDVTYLAIPDPSRAPEGALEPLAALGMPLHAVFAVPDDDLGWIAEAWAEGLVRAELRFSTALHTSGFHPARALEPLRDLGVPVARWHPLVAVHAPRAGAFRGVTVGLEGDGPAVAWGEILASALGARTLRIRPDEGGRYHSAAVFASNHLLACLAIALRQLRTATEEGAAIGDLVPLARSAVEGVARAGLVAGATGPVVRGDAATVAGHLRALDPETARLYRALAAELFGHVAASLDEEHRRSLSRVLGLVAPEARVAADP